jgi:hypothetical protein
MCIDKVLRREFSSGGDELSWEQGEVPCSHAFYGWSHEKGKDEMGGICSIHRGK